MWLLDFACLPLALLPWICLCLFPFGYWTSEFGLGQAFWNRNPACPPHLSLLHYFNLPPVDSATFSSSSVSIPPPSILSLSLICFSCFPRAPCWQFLSPEANHTSCPRNYMHLYVWRCGFFNWVQAWQLTLTYRNQQWWVAMSCI